MSWYVSPRARSSAPCDPHPRHPLTPARLPRWLPGGCCVVAGVRGRPVSCWACLSTPARRVGATAGSTGPLRVIDLRDDPVQVLDAALQEDAGLRVESAAVVEPTKYAAGDVQVEQPHVCTRERDMSEAVGEGLVAVFLPEAICGPHLLSRLAHLNYFAVAVEPVRRSPCGAGS